MRTLLPTLALLAACSSSSGPSEPAGPAPGRYVATACWAACQDFFAVRVLSMSATELAVEYLPPDFAAGSATIAGTGGSFRLSRGVAFPGNGVEFIAWTVTVEGAAFQCDGFRTNDNPNYQAGYCSFSRISD